MNRTLLELEKDKKKKEKSYTHQVAAYDFPYLSHLSSDLLNSIEIF